MKKNILQKLSDGESEEQLDFFKYIIDEYDVYCEKIRYTEQQEKLMKESLLAKI